MRRTFLHALAAAAGASVCPAMLRAAAAPLRIVVPFSAGGATDRLSRAVAQQLAALRNGPVIVDNRAGAGTIIGAQSVARAAPDGLTLLMATDSTLSINPFLYRTLPYDPVRDFVPISMIARIPSQVLLNPEVPARTPAEFIAHLRAKPGKLNYGSFGIGSTPHLATSVFMARTKTSMTHIPYKGVAECVTALLTGEIQVLIASISAPLQQVRAGKIRPILALSAQRHPLLPDVPTASEAGLGDFRWSAWYGLVAPAGTPGAALAALERDLRQLLSKPEFVHNELSEQALEPVELGAAAFLRTLETDRVFYAEAIRTAGVQPG